MSLTGNPSPSRRLACFGESGTPTNREELRALLERQATLSLADFWTDPTTRRKN